MKKRDIIPLSIGAVVWVVTLIILQFVAADLSGFLGLLALAFLIGDIFYILALFVTYLTIDSKELQEG